MRSIIFGILLALVVSAATAAEDVLSANHILPGCKQFFDRNPPSLGGALDQGICIGTVATIAFMAENSDIGLTALSGEGVKTAINRHWRCANIPAGVTQGQMAQVVIRYIEARPNRLHEPFRSLALEALLDAWPCRN
jgi:hypothetical protein